MRIVKCMIWKWWNDNRSIDYDSVSSRFLGHFVEEKSKSKFEEEGNDKAEDTEIVHSTESLPNWVSFIIFGPSWDFDNSEKDIKNDGNTNSCEWLNIKNAIQFVEQVDCTFVARGNKQRRWLRSYSLIWSNNWIMRRTKKLVIFLQ